MKPAICCMSSDVSNVVYLVYKITKDEFLKDANAKINE